MKKTKKYLNIVLVVALALIINNQAFAEESKTDEGTVGTPTTIRQEIEQEKEAYKTERDAIRDEARTKIEALKAKVSAEKNKAKATLWSARMASREKVLNGFEKAMGNIIDNNLNRVKEYTTKLEGMGIDTTMAKTYTATAETKLAEAKTKIGEAYTLISNLSVEKDLALADKTKLKTLSMEIQQLLKDSRNSLNMAVKSLKEGLKAKREEMKTSVNTDDTTPNTQTQ
jgi:hypothetical protein